MLVLDDIGSEGRCREPGRIRGGADADRTTDSAVVTCSCTTTELLSPAGPVVVVRVAGEIDMSTITILQAGLADSLARGPCRLVVDLAAVTFCDLHGMARLVHTGHSAAAHGVDYAVAGASRQLARIWAIGWPADELPRRYPSAAAATVAAMTAGARAATRP